MPLLHHCWLLQGKQKQLTAGERLRLSKVMSQQRHSQVSTCRRFLLWGGVAERWARFGNRRLMQCQHLVSSFGCSTSRAHMCAWNDWHRIPPEHCQLVTTV